MSRYDGERWSTSERCSRNARSRGAQTSAASVTIAANNDTFFRLASATGAAIWARGITGDNTNSVNLRYVAVDSTGRTIVGGGVNGSVTFGGKTATSMGGTDVLHRHLRRRDGHGARREDVRRRSARRGTSDDDRSVRLDVGGRHVPVVGARGKNCIRFQYPSYKKTDGTDISGLRVLSARLRAGVRVVPRGSRRLYLITMLRAAGESEKDAKRRLDEMVSSLRLR